MTDVDVRVTLDGGGSYEWNIVELGVDEVGGVWVRQGAGCSCNWIGDEPWAPVHSLDSENLAAAVRSWKSSYPMDGDAGVQASVFMHKVGALWRSLNASVKEAAK